MNSKIVGILVGMLLIATAIVSATSVKEENIGTTSYEVDVPVWEVGDSWTYNEHYNEFAYKSDGSLALAWYHNCTSTYTVTDDTGDTYTVAFAFRVPELRPGSYSISPALAQGNIWEHAVEDWIDNAYIFTLEETGLIYGTMKWSVDVKYRKIERIPDQGEAEST